MLRAFQKKEVIDSVSRLRSELDAADAVVIGAGAGLSASAGFAYTGGRFEKYFGIPAGFIRMTPWKNTGLSGAGTSISTGIWTRRGLFTKTFMNW